MGTAADNGSGLAYTVEFGALMRGPGGGAGGDPYYEQPMRQVDCASEEEAAALFDGVELASVIQYVWGQEDGPAEPAGAYKQLLRFDFGGGGLDDVLRDRELRIAAPLDAPGPWAVVRGRETDSFAVEAAATAARLFDAVEALGCWAAGEGQGCPEGFAPVSGPGGARAFASALPDGGAGRRGRRWLEPLAEAAALALGEGYSCSDVASAIRRAGFGCYTSSVKRAVARAAAAGRLPEPRALPEPMPEQERSLAGARVRAAREAKGWTQHRLAREAGCTQVTVSTIENGKTGVRDSACYAAICGALGIEDPSDEARGTRAVPAPTA